MLWTHAAAVLWLAADQDRLKLLAYDFREVPSEQSVALPPADLRGLGYTEDDPADLAPYRAIAAPIVSGALTDAERLRRLGNYIYGLRQQSRADLDEREVRRGPSRLLADMEGGDVANCGQMSAMVQVFWRSLGGDSRGVRWADHEGDVGHYGLEVYSPAAKRWLYYDMNLNGYLEDEDGMPLSVSSVRANLLSGEDLHFAANPLRHDWTPDEFTSFVRRYPVEWYALNNRFLYMEPNRRFGPLNVFYPLLSKLPYPTDRVVNNLMGARDRRMVVRGKVQVADLFTFRGAWLFIFWATGVVLCCLWTLMLTRPRRAAAPTPPINL